MSLLSPIINNIQYHIYNKYDYIQNILLNGIQWNNNIFNIIKIYISTYNLKHFLNVGSHIGSLSLPISLLINKVTSIEAYPSTYSHLCDNIKLNNINNIIPYNIALGNSKDNVYFMSTDKLCPIEKKNRILNNSGGMHVFTNSDIKNNIRSSYLCDTSVTGSMNTLDNLDIDYFDILLVDIEGMEYDFLLGAKQKILKYKPIIIIEIWNPSKRLSENMSISQQTVIDYIISLNYKLICNISDDYIFEPL